MIDSNVVKFRGMTFGRVSPSNVLDGAKDAQLDEVLVLGFDKDGKLYAASTTGDDGQVLLLMERFKAFLQQEWNAA